jgi:ketosteroid isomerase-like protein
VPMRYKVGAEQLQQVPSLAHRPDGVFRVARTAPVGPTHAVCAVTARSWPHGGPGGASALLARPQTGKCDVTHARPYAFRISAQTDWPERHRRTMESMNDAEAAARAIIDILATGDLDAVSSAVAEDYIDHQGLGDVEIRGLHGFRRVVGAVHTSSDVRVTIEDIVAAEDKAALRLRWHGINRAGRTVTRETLDLLRFADGRLIEHWGAELFRHER